MTLKQLLLTVSIATLVCIVIWVVLLFQIDPTNTDIAGFFLFYASLFLCLLGIFFLANFGWRKLVSKYALDYKLVGTSFRQSFFFSILTIVILLLQSRDLLTWWNIILIVLALTVVEGFILTIHKSV